MKIMTIVGARPNFMKAAPLIQAIRRKNEATERIGRKNGHPRPEFVEHFLVHTGQHYDQAMSDNFFADLGLPEPNVQLGVGSGTHTSQTAEIMKRFEEVLLREKPELIVVVGDVNSTVACALTAAKVPGTTERRRPLIAHVEAGLRSFDREMPEEINRIVTDHLADLLFVTEKSGIENLRREGIPSKKIFFVGNTMIDSLLSFKGLAEKSEILVQLGLRDAAGKDGNQGSAASYALLTLHRPANVDDVEAFREILNGLAGLSRKLPIIFPVHPRTRINIEKFGMEGYFNSGTTGEPKGITLVGPQGYVDFLSLMMNARLVLTDSGGIQEETTCLRVPCVTIRENTERPITIQCGTNVLAGASAAGIRKAIVGQLARKKRSRIPPKWDGKAAGRIVEQLVRSVTEMAANA